jgi:pantoate--beta-alanine ligase
MQVLTTVADFRRARASLPGSLGFVPTMGYLHEGHLSLVRGARAGNDSVAVSIFVNPTQFGPAEDFSTYPRDPDRDLALLRAEGVDLVFMPDANEMYPEGFQTFVEVEGVTRRLEGEWRPGHFRGVATVVLKLFEIVRPDRAYFGRKDSQQLAVVRRMVRDLNLAVDVVAMPTVRDADGLAMSSRNAYLSPTERAAATVLYRALSLAQDMWTKGSRDAEAYRRRIAETIAEEELASIDYVSVADPETMEELERIQGPALVSLAVRIGRTRLIDNVTLGE